MRNSDREAFPALEGGACGSGLKGVGVSGNMPPSSDQASSHTSVFKTC